MESVSMKLSDESPVVQKTARKLILEIHKVYPTCMEATIDQFKNEMLEFWIREVTGIEKREEEQIVRVPDKYEGSDDSEEEPTPPVQKSFSKVDNRSDFVKIPTPLSHHSW